MGYRIMSNLTEIDEPQTLREAKGRALLESMTFDDVVVIYNRDGRPAYMAQYGFLWRLVRAGNLKSAANRPS